MRHTTCNYHARHGPRERRGGTGFYLAWSQVSVAGGRNEPRAHLLFHGPWPIGNLASDIFIIDLSTLQSFSTVSFLVLNQFSPDAVVRESVPMQRLRLEEIAAVKDDPL